MTKTSCGNEDEVLIWKWRPREYSENEDQTSCESVDHFRSENEDQD